ncbi:MAG: succinyl-diaminopimelate desuccinylase [Mycobacteriales bacterium]
MPDPLRTALAHLDLSRPGPDLTADLVDVASVSGDERDLADAVELVLRELGRYTVRRDGDAVLASTDLGRDQRIVFAGHLDTVPIADNVPSRRDAERIHGCGASDMKSGDAVMLRLAASVADPAYDLTFVFYDNEEVEAERNGLGRIARRDPQLLAGDLAILMEPTDGMVEGGCQGTLRAEVRIRGRRAHSARSWLGDNAIHRAAPILATLAAYDARTVEIDGCGYREGLNAVRVDGGVAGNVIPDECTVTVNYRFAPDRDIDAAAAHVRSVFAGQEVAIVDAAPGALPGLDRPAPADFIAHVGQAPRGKYGWTDVSRFATLGIPAVNFGPGDPNLAHTREESVRIDHIEDAERILTGFLRGR